MKVTARVTPSDQDQCPLLLPDTLSRSIPRHMRFQGMAWQVSLNAKSWLILDTAGGAFRTRRCGYILMLWLCRLRGHLRRGFRLRLGYDAWGVRLTMTADIDAQTQAEATRLRY